MKQAPQKWIYFGPPRVAIVSHAWREWQRGERRKRKEVRRQRVINRDGLVCQLCGGDVGDRADLHIDHIIPLARGGGSGPSNLQVTHAACNLLKGAGGQ